MGLIPPAPTGLGLIASKRDRDDWSQLGTIQRTMSNLQLDCAVDPFGDSMGDFGMTSPA
jgi:hypothetical protein